MKFEYYVLNYNFNKKSVVMFNIFNNIYVQEYTEKAIKKYLRSPKNYKKIKQYKNEFLNREEIALYGFEGLCEEIRSIIMWQEWGRREYEISVADAFENDIDKLEKWDCYKQCEPNIEMIARECIYQYKKQLKDKNNEN